MTMNDVYRLNPEILTSTANGITRAISLDVDDSDVVVLKGPAAHLLKYFDGTATLSEIRGHFEKDLGVKGEEMDFLKLVRFLLEQNLLVAK